jgi:hypothetical protein
MLLAMSCVSVGIKFLLENHKKGKKIEEKIGLRSNTMEEELEINNKNNTRFFCHILNFRLLQYKLFKALKLFYTERSP